MREEENAVRITCLCRVGILAWGNLIFLHGVRAEVGHVCVQSNPASLLYK